MTTILVIAHEWDSVAAQVADTLRSNAFEVVTTAPSLLCGGAVTYLSDRGSTMWASTVPQPSVGHDVAITSADLGAVLNRAMHLDPTGFADEDDEMYATCERAALFTAMIESLDCTVLNRSQGTTLSGPPRLEAEWMAAAVRCGMAVRSMSWTSDGIDLEPLRRDLGAATVIGRRVIASAPVGTAQDWATAHTKPALALADELGCGLLHITLGETLDGRCVITQVDPTPPMVAPHIVVGVAQHLAAGIAPAWAVAS